MNGRKGHAPLERAPWLGRTARGPWLGPDGRGPSRNAARPGWSGQNGSPQPGRG